MNILQCNVTTWSEHVKHCIPTSNFDAALISETHLEREKLIIAAKEAKTFSRASTSNAAISTAKNGTSVGVFALVRTRWFSEPLSTCADETGFLCSNPQMARRVRRVMGWKILLFTAYFKDSVGLRSYINAKDASRVFSHERRKVSIHFGRGFQFAAKIVARFVHAWWQPLGTKVGSNSGHPRKTHAGQAKVKNLTPSIISWCQHSLDL